MHLRFAALSAAVAFAFAAPTCAYADEKVTIMVGGIDKQIYLPAKLTETLGYFKQEGVDVELLTEPAGVEAEDEILSGAIQGVVGFYDHTIDLQAKGKFLESVVQMSQAPGEVELMSTKWTGKSARDWRGKTLGVTGLGSSTNFITEYVAVKNGLKVSDITTLPVGAGNTFIVALQQGKIDGGMTTEPTVSRLLKTGAAKIMFDLRTADQTKKILGGLYPAASLYMQTSWVNAHPAETQKIANAFVKTLHWIATHSASQIADKLPSDYYAGDRASYVKALAMSKAMFTPDGVMPESGPKTVLTVLSSFNPNIKANSINLAQTFTTKFVKAAR